MTKSFSRVERDMLFTYIEKTTPELQLLIQHEPFLFLQKNTYTVKDEAIFFPFKQKPQEIQENQEVIVQFYYVNRALFFISTLKSTNNNTYVKIPKEIFKLSQAESLKETNFSGSIEYNVEKTVITIPCVSSPDFPLFCAAEKNNINDFLESFITKFFAENQTKKFAVLGKIDPLIILFISEKYVIFGGKENNFPFTGDFSCIFCGKFKSRNLQTECAVKKLFSHKQKRAVICEFTSVEPEDTRLLYETLYKKKFV